MIRAFKMWFYRRILGIKGTDTIRNEEVLARIGKKMFIWNYISKKKKK